MNWQAATVDDLEVVAKAVVAQLPISEQATILALQGDLGAGKTTFTQTLAQELGVSETVTSPTFVVMKSYPTADERFTTLVHIDAYRLESAAEIEVLGWSELLADSQALICLEWPEQIAAVIPEATPLLSITAGNDEVRTITLATYGEKN